MSALDLWCLTLERLGCGYYCWWEHMVWVVWQADSWQKSLRASADAAIAQTSKWWHNCHCCFDTTCFTVMTAMPFPERLVAQQNPSLFPTDRHTGVCTRAYIHTYTHRCMCACAWTQVHTKLGEVCLPQVLHPSPGVWSQLEREQQLENYFVLCLQNGSLGSNQKTGSRHQSFTKLIIREKMACWQLRDRFGVPWSPYWPAALTDPNSSCHKLLRSIFIRLIQLVSKCLLIACYGSGGEGTARATASKEMRGWMLP